MLTVSSKWLGAVLGPIAILCLWACSPAAPPATQADVVAVIDGDVITQDEVDLAVRAAKKPARGDDSTVGEIQDREIRRLAWNKLLVATWEDEIRKDDMWQRTEEAARREIWVRALATQVGEERVDIPEEEIEAEVERRREMSAERVTLRVRHIYLRADETMTADERAEQRRLAGELLDRARGGESFERLVHDYSQSETAAKGGVINALGRGMTPPAFDDVAFSLEKGEVGGVVETAHGFHVIKVEERFTAGAFNEEEARRVFADQMRTRFIDREMLHLARELRQGMEYEARWDSDGNLDPRPGDDAVLVVGDTVRTSTDVQEMIANQPGLAEGTAALAQALDEILANELLYDEARRTLVGQEERLEGLLTNAMQSSLQRTATLREVEQLREQITRAQLEEFASQYSGHLMLAGEIRPQLIFLPFDPEDPYQTFLDAEKLVMRVRAGEDFAQLAREYSRGPAADEGGDLGLVTQQKLGSLGLDVAKAIHKMAPGEVSDPIRIPPRRYGPAVGILGGGFAIVKLGEGTEPRLLQVDDDEDLVRRRYWDFYRDELLDAHIEKRLSEAGFRRVEGS